MTLAQAAANAQATINGIAVSSATNSLDGVIDGITFNLGKVTTQPVTVNITRNTDAIKTRVAAFVSAYNDLNSFLAQATHYDAASKQAALLQGDGTTTSIQNQLHTLVGQKSGASTTFATLSSIGVQLQKDGSLKLDDTAFANAVANLPQLTKALSNVDATVASNNGFGKIFSNWTTALLASNGSLPGKTKAIQDRIASNQKDQDTMNDRLTATEARLRAQYSALDTTMSQANALAKYVTQQFYFNNSFSQSLNSNSNSNN
jgi:flagellar hook-associated protein 2